jgi:hypothetical protein
MIFHDTNRVIKNRGGKFYKIIHPPNKFIGGGREIYAGSIWSVVNLHLGRISYNFYVNRSDKFKMRKVF